MDKEQAERNAKFLAECVEAELVNFLQKNPIEKLETIQQEFIRGKNTLHFLVSDLIKDLQKYDSRNDSPDKWQDMDGRIWVDISEFQTAYFDFFLYFNAIQAFFVNSPYNPINEEYRIELREKYKLTRKKFQLALFETLKGLFLEEVKRGGSKSELDEKKRLQFLALYNRYQIVIKNARAEKKRLKRLKKTDINAKREALAKYEIPESLIASAFSDDAASETALDWAKETLKLNSSPEYLRTLLIKIRKQYRRYGFVVDVDYSIGRRVYSVHPRNNKKHLEKLRYTPLEKPNEIVVNDPDNLLIEWNY